MSCLAAHARRPVRDASHHTWRSSGAAAATSTRRVGQCSWCSDSPPRDDDDGMHVRKKLRRGLRRGKERGGGERGDVGGGGAGARARGAAGEGGGAPVELVGALREEGARQRVGGGLLDLLVVEEVDEHGVEDGLRHGLHLLQHRRQDLGHVRLDATRVVDGDGLEEDLEERDEELVGARQVEHEHENLHHRQPLEEAAVAVERRPRGVVDPAQLRDEELEDHLERVVVVRRVRRVDPHHVREAARREQLDVGVAVLEQLRAAERVGDLRERAALLGLLALLALLRRLELLGEGLRRGGRGSANCGARRGIARGRGRG